MEYRYYASLAACDSDVAAFPGTPPPGGTLVSTVTVTGGVVPPSAAATFPAAGTFYWAAFYSGDPNNLPAASDCATEPLVVTPAPSRVTTELSANGREIGVGGSASDSATLTGVTGTAGGTVEYRYYDSLTACERRPRRSRRPGGTLVSTVTVTGGVVPPSAAATFPVAGTFYWAAFYSGDPSNPAAASDCATEPLVVTPAPSRVATQLSAAGGEIARRRDGERHRDAGRRHRHGGRDRGVPVLRFAGRVRQRRGGFPAPAAGGTLVSTETVTNGVVPPSAAATFPVAGTFYWAAFYSGDADDQAAASDCATEPLVVTPAPSRITTRLSADGAADSGWRVGERLRDAGRGDRHGGRDRGVPLLRLARPPASGDVAAFPGTAPAGGTSVSTVTVTNGVVPPSAAVTFPDAGTFYWAAFYSGEPTTGGRQRLRHRAPGRHPGAIAGRDEVVGRRRGDRVGGSASDTATLAGVTGTAGGTVEYRYYGSLAACDSDVAAFPGTAPPGGTLVSTVTVTGGVVPPSAAATFPAAGTFYWAAFYSGDPNNLPSASDCATEALVVTPAASQVTTVLSAAGGEIRGRRVGERLRDAARGHRHGRRDRGVPLLRLAGRLRRRRGGVPATPPSGGTQVSTETVTNGVVPPSAAVTFPAAGTFYWAAFYSGDPNNLPAASDCATEPLVVASAPSRGDHAAVGRQRADSGRRDGERLGDAHGVTGTAGGTVEYRYYNSLSACRQRRAAFPPASGGTLVSTVTVTSGVAPPSAAVTFPAAGTFYWAAFYSGDPSNLAAASDCATEPLVVTPALSQVTTQLSAAGGEIAVGGSASDSATLAGVTGTAGGTVEYRYYDSLSACQTRRGGVPAPPAGGTLVSTVTVTNGAVPPSAAARSPPRAPSTGPRSTPATPTTWRPPATAPPSPWSSPRRHAGRRRSCPPPAGRSRSAGRRATPRR